MNDPEEQQAFRKRLDSTLATVQAWDADETLLAECRAQIPFGTLRDDDGPHSRPQDAALSLQHRFVQRLARYFQHMMTWVNQPPCATCGGATAQRTVREPESVGVERLGQASRVEVYCCTVDSSHAETTFPRFNAVRTLLQTKQGRCGEYANLFGLFVRAVGLEARYILDWTDHVWTEVYTDESWMMVDSCEGVIDECSMYEAGWGKKLSYVVAVGCDHVVDVSAKYTRQWSLDEFQARRRGVIGSEAASECEIRLVNQNLQSKLPPKHVEKLERRRAREQAALQLLRD